MYRALFIIIAFCLIFSVPVFSQVNNSILSVTIHSKNIEVNQDEKFIVILNCGKFGLFEYNLSINQIESISIDELMNVTCRISISLSEAQLEVYSFVVGDDQGSSNGYVSGTPAKEFNGKTLWIDLLPKSTSNITTSNISVIATSESSIASESSATTTTESNNSQISESTSQSNNAIITSTSSRKIISSNSISTTKNSSSKSSKSSSFSNKSISTKSTSSIATSKKVSLSEVSTSLMDTNTTSEVSDLAEVNLTTNENNNVSMPSEEEILGLADVVSKKIGYEEQNYWLLSGSIFILILSLTSLFYYIKKNYLLFKFQNHESLVYTN